MEGERPLDAVEGSHPIIWSPAHGWYWRGCSGTVVVCESGKAGKNIASEGNMHRIVPFVNLPSQFHANEVIQAEMGRPGQRDPFDQTQQPPLGSGAKEFFQLAARALKKVNGTHC